MRGRSGVGPSLVLIPGLLKAWDQGLRRSSMLGLRILRLHGINFPPLIMNPPNKQNKNLWGYFVVYYQFRRGGYY